MRWRGVRPIESSVQASFNTQLRSFTLGIVGKAEITVRRQRGGPTRLGAIPMPNDLARMPERKAVGMVAQESDDLVRARNSLALNDLQRSIAHCIPMTIRLA